MEQHIREWTLHEELGRGGMGVVYRASHDYWNGEFAIKVIKPSLVEDEEVRTRFLAEAAIMGRLRHANIVESFPPFKEAGHIYLPMEYLQGKSLSDILSQHPGPWTVEKAVAIIRAAAAAVGYVHQLDPPVLHRDLKPGNLFICKDNTVKVMDFGLAKAIGEKSMTAAGMAVGTPAYMAPEVLNGKKATPSSDVYALGIVLYRLLAGRFPFEEPEEDSSLMARVMAVGMAHQRGLTAVSTYAPDISSRLEKVAMAAVATYPAERPQDAGMLADLLVSISGEDKIDCSADTTELGFSLTSSGSSKAPMQTATNPLSVEAKPLPTTVSTPPPVEIPSPTSKHSPVEPRPQVPDSLSYYDDILTEARKNEQRIQAENRRKEQVIEKIRTAWEKVQLICQNDAVSAEQKVLALQRFIGDFRKEENPFHQDATDKLKSISPLFLKTEAKTVTLKVPELYKKHEMVRPAGIFRDAQYGDVEHSRMIEKEVSFHHHKVVTHSGEVELDIGLFSVIPPGQFEMGNSSESNESPVHQVKIDYSFEMMQAPVTQGLWKAVMGNNPSRFSKEETNPVETVSWYDAVAFCNTLSLKAGLVPYYLLSDEKGCPGKEDYEANVAYNPEGRCGYRLPSEAEWEYACRAGTTGDHYGTLDDIAIFENNSDDQTQPVRTKLPNAFGLYDMLGNVWEWVEDCYHGTFQGAPSNGSAWVDSGISNRVLRGGSWYFCSAPRSVDHLKS